MDGCIFLQRDLAKDLHADDSVDEEDEDDEDGDPGQGLEGLDEGPEEGPDALPLREQLDQPHDAEETEEGNRDHVVPRLGEEARSDVLKGKWSKVKKGIYSLVAEEDIVEPVSGRPL